MRAPLLAAALMVTAFAPSSTRASSPETEVKDSPELTEAKALYHEGKLAFETGEYEEALELWKKAFRTIDDRAEFQTIRHTLVFNISEAHVRVYEVGRDITNLRKAKTLLEQYLANHVKLYGDDESARADRQGTERRLAEIHAMLEEAEAEQPAAPPPKKPGAGKKAAAPSDPIANAKLQRMREIKSDPALYRKDKRYKGMIIAGSVLTGVGGLLALGLVGGTTTTAGLATGASGVVALAAGVPILAIGVTRQKKLREPRLSPTTSPGSEAAKPAVAVAPWTTGRGTGVTFAVRF